MTLMMETERVSETLVFVTHLTRLIAPEDFIACLLIFSKNYINVIVQFTHELKSEVIVLLHYR
jgi:hypothetical protein